MGYGVSETHLGHGTPGTKQPAIIDGMGKKSDAAEIDRRIHTVVKMLASAKTSSYVIRFCSEEWGWVSEWRRNILPALAK